MTKLASINGLGTLSAATDFGIGVGLNTTGYTASGNMSSSCKEMNIVETLEIEKRVAGCLMNYAI